MSLIIPQSSASYPNKLLDLSDPPQQLYIRGSLSPLSHPCIGVVGSRKMTSYGKRALLSLVPQFVVSGCTIVSGLAFGVDVTAHQIALDHGGGAVAVLGSGIDDITPTSHQRIGLEIARRGLLISEYSGHTPAHKSHFPARNRIIAGLSDVLLVIEGTKRSGSLITADFMLQLGRDIFALPGNIDAPLSQGTNFLCSNGAHMLLDADDVLLRLGFDKNMPPHVSSDVSPEKRTLLDLLVKDSYTIDELCEQSGLSVETIVRITTQLELQQRITASADGKLYLKH